MIHPYIGIRRVRPRSGSDPVNRGNAVGPGKELLRSKGDQQIYRHRGLG